ncbi:GAF domain-containing protein [Halocalculus aciditolerans]|uniref:GAF domain-containing protein n=1 Tax=Halocalculus aciditolerans TaxID=1383812 RepID=A0A830FC12_9EURY|nr:GAF domain-containing protein [Halocalculus aciditolerans]GGL59874.1 hypothetical protein GCM10009039_17640 [Halocalculus aciditolerans]
MAAASDTRVRYRSADPSVREFFAGLSGFRLVDDAPDVVVADDDASSPTGVPTVEGPQTTDEADAPARLAVEVREAAGHAPLPYPVPRDENARLDALHRYDTTEQTLNAHLNALTVAVSASLETPGSFIGVVDEHVERVLADDGLGIEEIPRDVAACSYGILDDDPLVIDDVDADSRVDVTGLDLPFEPQSYAGAPIRTDDGHAVGMVCVLDERERSFGDNETDALTWFADEVLRHLDDYGRA